MGETMSDGRMAAVRRYAERAYQDVDTRAVQNALRDVLALTENGSCWDEGPTPIGGGRCYPLKCRLTAGHMGAHRDGHAEWMHRDAYSTVVAERDAARAALARVTDDAMAQKIAEMAYGPDDWTELDVSNFKDAIRAVAADEQEAGR